MAHPCRTPSRYLAYIGVVSMMLAGSAFGARPTMALQVTTAEPPSPPVTVPATIDMSYWAAHPPVYPAAALDRRDQGIVVLKVRVDPEGRPVRVVVDKQATHAADSLIQAAVTAAGHWRYNPRAEHGKTVSGWVLVPVIFRLPQGTKPSR